MNNYSLAWKFLNSLSQEQIDEFRTLLQIPINTPDLVVYLSQCGDGNDYDKGFEDGKEEGFQEAKEAAMDAITDI